MVSLFSCAHLRHAWLCWALVSLVCDGCRGESRCSAEPYKHNGTFSRLSRTDFMPPLQPCLVQVAFYKYCYLYSWQVIHDENDATQDIPARKKVMKQYLYSWGRRWHSAQVVTRIQKSESNQPYQLLPLLSRSSDSIQLRSSKLWVEHLWSMRDNFAEARFMYHTKVTRFPYRKKIDEIPLQPVIIFFNYYD